MMRHFKPQRVRDPVHDLIEFHDDEFEHVMWKVVQTEPFQRLRRIKQLGFSEFVYPGATHSRLAHSLGVFHTGRRLMEIIQRHLREKRKYLESKAHVALAAALVHDLGHGPFSHAFESVGKDRNLALANHETLSERLIRDSEVAEVFKELGSGFPNDVADMIKPDATKSIYTAVVSSQFDADRLDYIRRDRLMTGTRHAQIDFSWLMANIEVGEVHSGVDDQPLPNPVVTFVLGPKALHAAEAYVLGLFQLYPTVYLHKTTRGAEKLFVHLLQRVFQLIDDDSLARCGLPANHPIVAFAISPNAVDAVLRLDDAVLSGALGFLSDAEDPIIQNAANRLRLRKFYTSIDIRASVEEKFRPSSKECAVKINRVCAAIKDKIVLDGAALLSSGKVLLDEAERSPYKQIEEAKKGPLNQINIRIGSGSNLVDLGKHSRIVAAIETFRLLRAYFAKDDDESKEFLNRIIGGEISNANHD
jgi:uncharacterized protein